MNELPAKPRRTARWIKSVAVAFAACALLAAGAYGLFLYQHWQRYQKLSADCSAIRERGEPLGGEMLDEFYVVPDDGVDNTEAVTAALQPFAGVDSGPDGMQLKELSSLPKNAPPHRPEDWSQLAEAEAIVEKYEQQLEALRAALSSPGYVRYPTDYSRKLVMAMPADHLTQIRDSQRLLVVQALCFYQRGELDLAAQNVVALLRLSETLRLEPFAVGQLIRGLTWNSAVKTFLFLAADADLSTTDILRVQFAAGACDFDDAYYRTCIGERAVVFESFKLTFDALDWDQPPPENPRGKPIYKIRPGDAATTLRYFTMHVQASQLPWREAAVASGEAERQVEAEMEASARLNPLQRNIVASILYQPLEVIFKISVRRECERRALITICALERARREQKSLPVSLTDLVPEYLPAVPTDPLNDQPLRYLQEDAQYIVYSVGLNQQDDQGSISGDTPTPPDLGLSLP